MVLDLTVFNNVNTFVLVSYTSVSCHSGLADFNLKNMYLKGHFLLQIYWLKTKSTKSV